MPDQRLQETRRRNLRITDEQFRMLFDALRDVGSVQTWSQPYLTMTGTGTGKTHSAKPDGALDLIERASPGPYVELFARRARMGWDYWGNESLSTAEMPDVA